MIEIIKQDGGGGGGIESLNGLTATDQFLAVGTSGTDFAISSSVDTSTFNLPTASAINRGALSAANWSTFNGKQDALVSGTNIKTINSTSILGSGNLVVAATPSGVSGAIQFSDGSALASDATNFFWDDANNRLGIGTNTPQSSIHSKLATFNQSEVEATGATARSFLRAQVNNNDTYIDFRAHALSAPSSVYAGVNMAGGNFIWSSPIAAGLMIANAASTPIYFGVNGGQVMALLSGGNVGINTSAPTAKLHVVGSGATSATNSILVQNSSSNQTFSVRDDGVVFVGLGGLLSGSVKFQVKDQSDNVCLAVSQSDTVFGNSTVLRSMDGILYPTGNIIFRNGNPNSAIINFGDSEVNSASATGVFSFIKFTRNWTSVAPSLNLTINVQETNNVINMTNGTGTKIFRGIYHNPTVTAVTSHRAFESSSGGGYFNTTSVDASAVLQADSTTQGFLPPRMTTAQINAIVTPAEGLVAYNTTISHLCCYQGGAWVRFSHSPM
jgi:hypothetical protein